MGGACSRGGNNAVKPRVDTASSTEKKGGGNDEMTSAGRAAGQAGGGGSGGGGDDDDDDAAAAAAAAEKKRVDLFSEPIDSMTADQAKKFTKRLMPNRQVGMWLKNVPLLSRLNEFERNKLGGAFRELRVNTGVTIFNQGSAGNAFYIIRAGTVRVLQEDGADTMELCTLTVGDYFGEMALLNDAPRGATVVASTDVTAIFLSKSRFEALFSSTKLLVNFVERRGISAEIVASVAADGENDKTALMTTVNGLLALPGGKNKKGGKNAGRFFSKLNEARPANAVFEKSKDVTARLTKAIATHVLFMDFDSEQREELLNAMYKREVDKGVVLIEQGDMGLNLYVIETGAFDVSVKTDERVSVFGDKLPAVKARLDAVDSDTDSDDDDAATAAAASSSIPEHGVSPPTLPVADLGTPGLRRPSAMPRNFSSVLKRQDSKRIKNPGWITTLREWDIVGELAVMYSASRAASVVATKSGIVWCVDRFTFRRIAKRMGAARMDKYDRFLANVELLQPLSSHERSKISEALEEVSMKAGEIIFTEDDADGDCMYIIKSGTVEIMRVPTAKKPLAAEEAETGDERKKEKGEEEAKEEKEEETNGSDKVDAEGAGAPVSPPAAKGFSISITPAGAAAGSDLPVPAVTQKKKSMSVPAEMKRRMSVQVTTLGDGAFFGERALMKNEPRSATVCCITNVVLLRLDRASFSLLLGPLAGILKKADEEYDVVNDIAPQLINIPLKSLSTVGVLGKGSFGIVTLVRHGKKSDGVYYALKAVGKKRLVEVGQEAHIMNEKNVLSRITHPFMCRLYQTYQDKKCLYFLFDPVLGGELFTVLRKRQTFPSKVAQFYAAQVVLMWDYLHQKNIVHRDLKPENLLVCADGYLKLTDFGFAKRVTSRTWTLCGTPDYLAPEIVGSKGHGKGVDWWTLGILIYEMLASYPPFYDSDQMKIYKKIMACQVRYPSDMSEPARDIIARLLSRDPSKRLGVVIGGAETVKAHPWLKSIDFTALLQKKIKPPILPVIDDVTDRSNFAQRNFKPPDIPDYDGNCDWAKAF
jgi:protein kinase A